MADFMLSTCEFVEAAKAIANGMMSNGKNWINELQSILFIYLIRLYYVWLVQLSLLRGWFIDIGAYLFLWADDPWIIFTQPLHIRPNQ